MATRSDGYTVLSNGYGYQVHAGGHIFPSHILFQGHVVTSPYPNQVLSRFPVLLKEALVVQSGGLL